jgi:hypothetical protein
VSGDRRTVIRTENKTGTPDTPEVPVSIGGPSRTRTLDLLIKRPNPDTAQNHSDALNPQRLELWPSSE